MPLCDLENCPGVATKRCSACKYIMYCSERCQSIAWRWHKYHCPKLKLLGEAEAMEPAVKTRKTHCTGCKRAFNSEDYARLDLIGQCPDCGYMACEKCHVSFKKGSCFCQNSNFGNKYCIMEPRWYHWSSLPGGKRYIGDRHPQYPLHPRENALKLEDTPRPCGNCGEVNLCFKKEYLEDDY
ncbi:hypothetical protein BDZ89DRAFT_988689 [Hymenopellis radicata]|nr:hypothetical protein BDZ89DRAFT_988689 [Hymenopellis radicata]